jgi:hypothetical protein
MKKFMLLTGALIAAHVSPSLAQSLEERATYVALSRTPVGALAPLLTNTLINRLQNGASLALRYGNLASGDFNASNNAFAVTGILPAGLGSSVRITGGFNDTDCADCDPDLMLSLGGDIRLVGSSMGTTATSPLWTVSLDGELGYANRNPGTTISGYVGIPIALVQRGSGMQFVPFITPAYAFAQTTGQPLLPTQNGAALMLGGGLGIYNTESSVMVNVGIQHAFMTGARNVIGINVALGGK